jgi:hypothetical protein
MGQVPLFSPLEGVWREREFSFDLGDGLEVVRQVEFLARIKVALGVHALLGIGDEFSLLLSPDKHSSRGKSATYRILGKVFLYPGGGSTRQKVKPWGLDFTLTFTFRSAFPRDVFPVP